MFNLIKNKKSGEIFFGINNEYPEYNIDINGNGRINKEFVVNGDVSLNNNLYVGRNILPPYSNSNKIGDENRKWLEVYSDSISTNNISSDCLTIKSKSHLSLKKTGKSKFTFDNNLYDYPNVNGGDINIVAGDTISTSDDSRGGNISIQSGSGNYKSKHGNILLNSKEGDINMISNSTLFNNNKDVIVNNNNEHNGGFIVNGTQIKILHVDPSNNSVNIQGDLLINGCKTSFKCDIINNNHFEINNIKNDVLYRVNLISDFDPTLTILNNDDIIYLLNSTNNNVKKIELLLQYRNGILNGFAIINNECVQLKEVELKDNNLVFTTDSSHIFMAYVDIVD
jgi:hypothetical protein